MKKIIQYIYIIDIILFVISLTLIIYSLDFPFYWDNAVQISYPANWYYETNFKYFYLPDNVATGHPTFVGMYFAFLWKLFGRSLFICHLGMFPFVFGLLIQIHRLLSNLKINNFNTKIIILSFIIFDTTILSQLSLITFDIIQLFFFVLCINSILKNKKWLLSFSFCMLIMTSLRGTISAGGIVIFFFLYNYIITTKLSLKSILVFLPGIISIVLFLFLFKYNKGWIVHNTVSNAWEDSGKFASLKEIFRNIGVFIWRLIDYGRVLIYLFFVFFLFKIISKRNVKNKALQILLLIAISQFIVLFPIIIIYKNPFAHRYLIPIIIPITILVIYWVRINFIRSKLLLIILFTCLFSGHFWLYPEKISQSWDGSTIHWNFFNVAKKMDLYFNNNNIDRKEVGTFFSLYQSQYYSHINSKKGGYKKVNMNSDKYILYSNSFNVTDGVVDSIHSDKYWLLVKEFKHNNIFLRLYKNKAIESNNTFKQK